MVKKLMGVGLALVMVGVLLAACTGLPGQPGQPGLPGNPGQSGLQGPAAELPTTTIVVTPASGAPKASITILGAGFEPGEEILVEMVIEGTACGLGYREKVNGEMKRKHVADEYGTFRAVSAVPHKTIAIPGVHPVMATGDKGSQAIFPFEVK